MAARQPAKVRFVGLRETYAESGPGSALLEKYGLTAQAIVDAARSL